MRLFCWKAKKLLSVGGLKNEDYNLDCFTTTDSLAGLIEEAPKLNTSTSDCLLLPIRDAALW